MANGKLVPVGRVFEIFPGKRSKYFGIEVTDNIFGTGNTLIFRPPNGDSSKDVSMKISTIELNRRRANRVDVGDQCAIRPVVMPVTEPQNDWQVLVPVEQSAGAATRDKKITSRPTKPNTTTGKKSHFGR